MKKVKFFSVLAAVAIMTVGFNGCKGEGEDPLPPIGGYNSADEVGKADLVAYWALNGDGDESLSKTKPSKSEKVTWVDGIKGKAAKFEEGYLAYDAIANLGKNLESGFTVSCWIKINNNGSTIAPLFSLSRAGQWAGNLNFLGETGRYGASSDSIVLKGLIVSKNDLGWQDVVNTIEPTAEDIANGHVAYTNRIGGKWAHAVITWDNTTKLFKVFVDGVKISNPVWENRDASGTKNFEIETPTRPIIGALETVVDGTNNETWVKALTGQIDELRVWKRALILSDIGALYQLEKAGR